MRKRRRNITFKEIKEELEKIYRERSSWDGGKGLFTTKAIKRRELLLVKQRLLYQLEDAKLSKNRSDESFYLILYEMVNDYLKKFE